MQLFKFFHTENTSKQQKMVAFVRNCLVKMILKLFILVNFRCYEYVAKLASEAVQKVSTRTLLELCKLTKTSNFIATPMKKHI